MSIDIEKLLQQAVSVTKEDVRSWTGQLAPKTPEITIYATPLTTNDETSANRKFPGWQATMETAAMVHIIARKALDAEEDGNRMFKQHHVEMLTRLEHTVVKDIYLTLFNPDLKERDLSDREFEDRVKN